MKAIWSGSISFGLVNIPVMLHSAIKEHSFGFRMLCGTCHNALTYVRWCKHCKKEVRWDNIVKGLKQPDGNYFVLDQEAIKKLKPESTNVITIKEFVDQSEIIPLYIEDHYYLSPAKKSPSPFFLFLEALKKSQKVAIGQMVMHEKEHVVAISGHTNILLMTTLHYEYEIRQPELEYPKEAKPSKQDLTLALQLINKLTRKKFDLSKYKNTFVEDLKKAIAAAKKGKKHTIVRPKKTTKQKTLHESLRASLGREARA